MAPESSGTVFVDPCISLPKFPGSQTKNNTAKMETVISSCNTEHSETLLESNPQSRLGAHGSYDGALRGDCEPFFVDMFAQTADGVRRYTF